MPQTLARRVDVRADPIPLRIAAIDDFVAAGYEVHINFSPVILYDGWEADYDRLLEEVADAVGPAARQQLKAEIIMLTHNAEMHEVNMAWHPKGEEVLWRPDLQQVKRSEGGGWNLRYRNHVKAEGLARLQELLSKRLPECMVRYAF
jgi:DNA repair photolyase